MKAIIEQTLEKSYSYAAYRAWVSEAMENNPETLQLQEGYLPYAQLNETRLSRLDKTAQIRSAVQNQLDNFSGNYIWLVLSESWCGDAVQALPYLDKMTQNSKNIELLVAFRDQNIELMDQFLTQGGRAIPKLIVLDKASLKVLGSWGPRTLAAQAVVDNYKKEHGSFDEEGIALLQKWYNQDKGQTLQTEIAALMQEMALQKI